MKRISIAIAMLIAMVGCKKSNPSARLLATLSFDANGIHYIINGDLVTDADSGACIQQTIHTTTMPYTYTFDLRASNGITEEQLINGNWVINPTAKSLDITIYSGELDTLYADPYTELTSEIGINAIGFLGYNEQLTITNEHNGLYDGTFSGILNQVNPSSSNTLNVTNGQFMNLKMIYK